MPSIIMSVIFKVIFLSTLVASSTGFEVEFEKWGDFSIRQGKNTKYHNFELAFKRRNISCFQKNQRAEHFLLVCFPNKLSVDELINLSKYIQKVTMTCLFYWL